LKALILAGGFATRLRPLSCSKPKLLFPLVGVPLINRLVDWLSEANVTDVVLAVNHLSEKLRSEITTRKFGSNVALSVEDIPLGTGGPVKLAAPLLSPREPVIVINGDVVSNIDVRKLLAAHFESGAEATVALVSVEDPRPYGLADVDSKDRIVGFEEKSSNRTSPGWINAGIYALNPSVIRMIPDGRQVSLEREIFPLLAQRRNMNAWKHRGYWFDIGKIRDYILANRALLTQPSFKKVNMNGLGSSGQIEEPSYVAESCRIEDTAKLGPYTILSPLVRMSAHSAVRKTIVFEESVIGTNCLIEDSVIGERVTIGNGVKVGPGSVIAGQITIPDRMDIQPGSVILN